VPRFIKSPNILLIFEIRRERENSGSTLFGSPPHSLYSNLPEPRSPRSSEVTPLAHITTPFNIQRSCLHLRVINLMNLKNNIIYNFIFLENYAQVLKFSNIILIFDMRERERESSLGQSPSALPHILYIQFSWSPGVSKLRSLEKGPTCNYVMV
jgi:hypothetical protein